MSSSSCLKCKQSHSDPRILSCCHSYCLLCIQTFKKTDINSISCPQCQHITLLHEGSISSLPRNLGLINKQDNILHKFTYALCDSCGEDISIAYCVECTDHLLCKGCLSAHQKLRSSRGHSSFTFAEAQKMPQKKLMKLFHPTYSTCSDHAGNNLDFYCQKCFVLTCSECINHKDHNVIEANEVVNDKKQAILQLMQGLQTAEEHLRKLLEEGEEIKEEIESNKDRIDSLIHRSIIEFHKLLHNCEEKLLTQNNEASKVADAFLSQQLKEIERILAGVTHCYSLSTDATEQYNDIGLLSIVDTLTCRVNQLQQKSSRMSLESCKPPDVSLDMRRGEIGTSIVNLSVLYNGAFPSNTTIDVVLSHIPVGRESRVKLTTRDNAGKELSTGGTPLRGKLAPVKKKRNSTEVDIVDCGNGTYMVSIIPEELGQHKLSVTIQNQSIRGSPYYFNVSRDYTAFNKPVQIINGVQSPQFIAFSNTGDIYVTSGTNHCVYVFDSIGRQKTTIGSHGKGPGQFQFPTGIAITGNVMYVAEYEGNRIQKLTLEGEFLGSFGSEGTEESQLWYPWGMCTGANGKIYITEFGNNRIQVFDEERELFTNIIDGNVSGDGCFQCPRDVSFDYRSGHIHISSYNSQTITVFTLDGVHIQHYGNFKEPFGLTFDESTYTIVTDRKENRLSIFDYSYNEYTLVHSVSAGLKNPLGVSMAPNGSIWVADNGNNRLVKF